MTSLADLDRASPTMLEMLAPTLFQRERHSVVLSAAELGAVAVVMLNEDPTCDELELAMCVHAMLAMSGRGLLVAAQ